MFELGVLPACPFLEQNAFFFTSLLFKTVQMFETEGEISIKKGHFSNWTGFSSIFHRMDTKGKRWRVWLKLMFYILCFKWLES